MAYVQAFMALLPYIMSLLKIFVKTPVQERDTLIAKIHDAINLAETTGDTSKLEDVFKG